MLNSLFRPKSVAVIGASNRKLTIGYRIIQNLLDSQYNGPIYPVHPKASFIKSIPAYPNVTDIPGDVELVHIVVKNTLVPKILADCGKKGVKVAIINTAGFKEAGKVGIKLEKEIVKIAKENNIRIFGPNCQGIINSDNEVRAYCNFTFTKLRAGHVSLMAQSGGVGEVINNRLFELGAGIRMYASNGNAADISMSEIVEYWGNDPDTKVIICHIESLSDPKNFLKIAKKVSQKKPILAIKTGRTKAGAKAVSSHTGGLVKQDTTTELILKEAGILSFHNTEELCQAAYAFANQPLPKGNRVGIVTNTGGPGIIATDEIIEAGCLIPDLSSITKAKLKEILFDEATISNPVDVIATAGPDHYEAAVEALLDDENIDSVLINFITPFFVDCEGVANKIAAVVANAKKPVVAVVMTEKESWANTLKIFRNAQIPVFDFPETGAKAITAMMHYAMMKQRPVEEPAKFDNLDRAAAAEIIKKTKQNSKQFIGQKDAFDMLAAYGISSPMTLLTTTLDQTLAAANKIGYPVALKVDSDKVVHKSDSGGVVLGISNDADLTSAFASMKDRFNFKDVQYLVASMQKPGLEIIIGAKKEQGLGHVIVFGLGGIFVEILADASFGLAPLSKTNAQKMIEEIKGYALLQGARGQNAIDIKSLVNIICRLSQMVADNPQIEELDLNPVFVYADDKPISVDVRIKLED